MTQQTDTTAQVDAGDVQPAEPPVVDPSSGGATEAVEVQTPEFQEMNSGTGEAAASNLDRLGEIRIALAAELGRTELPIQKLLQVGPGTVLTLDRNINSPVEIVAQGVPLAKGEVVVVDNCFAIRVLEVYQSLKQQSQQETNS